MYLDNVEDILMEELNYIGCPHLRDAVLFSACQMLEAIENLPAKEAEKMISIFSEEFKSKLLKKMKFE